MCLCAATDNLHDVIERARKRALIDGIDEQASIEQHVRDYLFLSLRPLLLHRDPAYRMTALYLGDLWGLGEMEIRHEA